MRKIIILIISIIVPFLINAQPNGDGSYGNPWSGTLAGNTTWSGTKYINGDITIDNEKLTISAGAIIIFLSETADLIITGTGQIEAVGTSGSMIRFTSDDNNNGIYGETGERWGHISFESMGAAGASVFDNCIIEYGDVSSFSNTDPHGGGGGIFIDFNNVSITNCIIQHNKSQWGGGIFVHQNRYPGIGNCTFYDNSAEEAGGGIFLWDYASSVIENSIFYSNICKGTSLPDYTGGGLAALSSCNVKVVNCTFSNNTSLRTEGQGLMLSYSSGSQVINSIFWGSTNQVYLASGTNGNTIINCAIQAGVPFGSVNCITLNSSNTASDGPNFSATNGTDWSILFISPCRDAGTTPSPTVPIDYIGNPRIGPYDIGAYEVKYSRWTGATNDQWGTQSNWDGNVDPMSGTGDIIIPSDLTYYPTGDASQGFVIASGKYMILNPGAKVTFSSLKTTGGTLKLESDASRISSLIVNNLSGTATVELFLTGGGGSNYKWHYISSPVASLPVSTFAPTPTIDFVQYFEARPSTDPIQGWIGYDGYIYFGEDHGPLTGLPYDIRGTNLSVGQGYNYYKSTDQKITFSGTLNTADIVKGITYSGIPALSGFNLLGNPFSSGLDWDYIVDPLHPERYPSNTSKGLYFTRDNSQCSYIAGVGYPDASVTGVIPPMQGFFIKTINTSTSITLPVAARVHNIPARYKGLEIIPLIRIELNDNGIKDNTVIRFDSKANSGLDNDFDAVRMFLSDTKPSIYSSLGNTKYAINGQPFPDTFVEIPVVVNLTTSGNHTISKTQLQGLDNYNVTLIDKTTGFSANLKTTPNVAFTASAGTITDRFILKVSNSTTGIENPVASTTAFNIYPANNMINIQPLSNDWDGKTGSVKVLDLTGKTVVNLNNSEFWKNSLIQVATPMVKGVYIVELKSGALRYVGKVVIR